MNLGDLPQGFPFWIVENLLDNMDSDDAEILTGGDYDDSKGYFIEPTTILTTNPHFKTMEEEIFGPVLTVYIYNPNDWEEYLSVDITGSLLTIQQVIPYMKKQGFGKVITVSSVNAVFGVEKETAYSVAKAGVLQLTRSLAKELRKDGINVNCIMPGPVKTGRFMSTLKGRNKHDLEKINSTSKLDRVANPDDISPVVEFLFSDASDFISGELIRVDGGLFPQPM